MAVYVYIVLGLICIAFGIFALVDPEKSISIRNTLRFRYVEPNDWYVGFTRFSGGFLVLVGIITFICAFTL